MADQLEYVVRNALMVCDKGAAPGFFMPTHNMHIKANGCLLTNEMDKLPIVNIPSFGVCVSTRCACVPSPIMWQKTYKAKVKSQETILFRSTLPCALGGKIQFVTSGQIPLPEEALDDIEAMREHGQEEEDEGWTWLDTVELIPVVGSIVGAVREGIKGNWGMMAANIGFLVMDVAGVVSGGTTTVAATAAKTAIKTGTKVVAKTAAKTAAKQAGKSGLKTGLKLSAKGALKSFAKGIDKIILKATGNKLCVFACFPAGTPVHTEDGVRPIEDVKTGDKVWSYNEENGEVALQEVVQTNKRDADITLKITIGDETIETTAEHPFYTQDGWKDAADLDTTDFIKKKDGTNEPIKSIEYNYNPKKVFNFEVANWHTYFVGIWAWLVHNAKKCISKAIKKVSDRLKYVGRTPGKNSKTGKEVFERMLKEKPPTARVIDDFGNAVEEFWDPKNKVWRNISEADMGHIHDAVTWWNQTGRKFGPKSKEVREWMLDSKNYVLEYYKTNRSKGAILGQTEKYLPPL